MLLKSLKPLTFNYPRNWLVGTKLGWILGCIDNLSLDPKKKGLTALRFYMSY